MISEPGCSDRKHCVISESGGSESVTSLYLRTLVNAACNHEGRGNEEFFTGAELHLHRRKRFWRVGCTAKNG